MSDQPNDQPQQDQPIDDKPAPKPERHTVATLADRVAELEHAAGIRRDASDDQG